MTLDTLFHRVSLGRIGLAFDCAYWARPDVEVPKDVPGRAARIGTLVHRLAECHVTGKSFHVDDVDLHELAEAQSIFAGPLRGWLDTWAAQPVPHAVEMRLRYDAEKHEVREVPRRDEPGYAPPGPSEVTGEIDLAQNHGTHVDVIDLKTGQKRHVSEEQLHGYGVLAERFWKVPKVRVAFLYARKTKTELTPWVELDVDRLDATAGRIRRVLRTLPEAQPVPGDHCYRCPLGKGRCPAFVTTNWEERESALLDDVRLF